MTVNINPQAVFGKLQARIAQLALDLAVTEAALDETQAQFAALEKEHANCAPEAGKGKPDLPVKEHLNGSAGRTPRVQASPNVEAKSS